MALTPGSAVFLDTNILVYASFPGTQFYDGARARLTELESDGVLFWTSRQVLREYLASTPQPGAKVPPPTLEGLSVSRSPIRSRIRDRRLGRRRHSHPTRLVEVAKCPGKQIHDANIVATMLRYGIPWLLTHNTADFTRYVPDINIMPLVS